MSDESQAIEQAVSGDVDALVALLRKHGPVVRDALTGKIATKYRSAFDIEDVMSVTYCEAFRCIERFVYRDDRSFGGWLRRIAENNLRDAIKEMQRNKRIPPDRLLQGGFGSDDSFVAFIDVLSGTGTSASQCVAKGDARRIIEQAITQLPPDYQQVVTLYELQGMSAEEVAKTMGRSVGAIYMVRKRALEALRGLLPSQSQI